MAVLENPGLHLPKCSTGPTRAGLTWKSVMKLTATFPSVFEVPASLIISSHRTRLKLLSFQKDQRQLEEVFMDPPLAELRLKTTVMLPRKAGRDGRAPGSW